MLQKKVIEQKTLDLLIKIQSIAEFKDLRLVGGTALALQFGHRQSIDLDFFGNTTFENISFENILSSFESVRIVNNRPFIKQYFINDVKVDYRQGALFTTRIRYFKETSASLAYRAFNRH